MYGGIETGGTKTVCAVGRDGVVMRRAEFPTGDDPELLVQRCAAFFADQDVLTVAVATFGPCDPDPTSPTYGHILATPKPGWAHTDLLGRLASVIRGPLVLTTDVNAAALGEQRFGNAQGLTDVVYLTIGTGIGGGAIVNGLLAAGSGHPEMGHMRVPSDLVGGVCPFHADCLEGFASGPAMAAREGRPGPQLRDDDPAWDVEAQIVATGLHAITCVLRPQMIVIGGGVGSRTALHQRLPALLEKSLAGYLPAPAITPPGLGGNAGVVGALTMAQDHSQG